MNPTLEDRYTHFLDNDLIKNHPKYFKVMERFLTSGGHTSRPIYDIVHGHVMGLTEAEALEALEFLRKENLVFYSEIGKQWSLCMKGYYVAKHPDEPIVSRMYQDYSPGLRRILHAVRSASYSNNPREPYWGTINRVKAHLDLVGVDETIWDIRLKELEEFDLARIKDDKLVLTDKGMCAAKSIAVPIESGYYWTKEYDVGSKILWKLGEW